MKTAIVTGASRGIGKTIALTLAREGYNVVITYNTKRKKAEDVAKQIKAYGVDSLVLQCDISNEDSVKTLTQKSIERFGRIDVLVNNAAMSIDSLFRDKTVANFKRTLEVNLIGTFLVSKYIGETMYESKYGKIINISSTNGINTYFPMCLDYDASKSGVISLTHNLAMQFAPYINVNAIAPGFIATESEVSDMDEEFVKSEEEKILLKRAGTEQDVANLVKFLASDESSYINNEVIRIDGGMYGTY